MIQSELKGGRGFSPLRDSWYVFIYVRGDYIGAYRHATEDGAAADCERLNRSMAHRGLQGIARFIVSKEPPLDLFTVEPFEIDFRRWKWTIKSFSCKQ